VPLRYAWRTLRRSPLYTGVALVSLSLGLGFSGAVFIFAWPILFRDLPVAHAGELLEVASTTGDRFSYPLFQDLRDRTPVFAALAARCATPVDLRENNRTRRIHAEVVSGAWFETLGLGVALGRGLTPEDDRVPGGHSVAVLTYDFWHSHFGGDRDVLRKVILLNGHPMTVVGVAARGYRGFDLGERTDVLVPTMMQAAMIPAWYGLQDRGRPWLQLVGRLRPGTGVEQAEARLDPFYRTLSGLDRRSPGVVSEGPALQLVPAAQGISELRGRLDPRLRRLCWWAVLIWIFVCANYAALLVARSAARQREVAIRIALGATRRRALHDFAVEGAVLGTLATAVGLLVAAWIGGGALDLVSSAAATGLSARIEPSTVIFMLALALLSTALLAGIPVLRGRNTPLAQLLNQRPENAPAATGSTEWLKAVVAVEVAVALALVWHAGAMANDVRLLSHADLGFPRAGLLSFSVDPELAGYSPERVRRFSDQLRERLTAIPGVQGAALANGPVLGEGDGRAIPLPGRPPAPPVVRSVGPGYFATLGVPLRRGREFTAADRQGVMVNAAYGAAEGVTGVAGNVRSRLDEPPGPAAYLPLFGQPIGQPLVVYVRAAGDHGGIVPSIYRTVAEMDPALPVTDLRSMRGEVADALAPERVAAAVAATLAGIAVLLAAAGLYTLAIGVAARRRREFGIRLALGASRHGLRQAIAREVGLVAVLGCVLGSAVAVWLGRVL
jgi:putative ABC transport system permease protein